MSWGEIRITLNLPDLLWLSNIRVFFNHFTHLKINITLNFSFKKHLCVWLFNVLTHAFSRCSSTSLQPHDLALPFLLPNSPWLVVVLALGFWVAVFPRAFWMETGPHYVAFYFISNKINWMYFVSCNSHIDWTPIHLCGFAPGSGIAQAMMLGLWWAPLTAE